MQLYPRRSYLCSTLLLVYFHVLFAVVWSFGFIVGVLKLFTLSLQATDESSQCVHQTGDNSEACIYVHVRQRENKNCKLAELITFGYIQSKQSNKQEKKKPNVLLLPLIYCFYFLSLKLGMFYWR